MYTNIIHYNLYNIINETNSTVFRLAYTYEMSHVTSKQQQQQHNGYVMCSVKQSTIINN